MNWLVWLSDGQPAPQVPSRGQGCLPGGRSHPHLAPPFPSLAFTVPIGMAALVYSDRHEPQHVHEHRHCVLPSASRRGPRRDFRCRWRKSLLPILVHRATEVTATTAPGRPALTPAVREGGLRASVAVTSVARSKGAARCP